MFTFISMFTFRFACITFILWLNIVFYLHMYKGKNILPSQVPKMYLMVMVLNAIISIIYIKSLVCACVRACVYDHWT
jgi:hypothetical protein